MRELIHYNPQCNASRWLAYFDLLGIRSLIQDNRIMDVFCAYSSAVEEAKNLQKDDREIRCFWFSDSFVTYSETDSASDFALMDQFARWFTHFLLTRNIPFRGAISCGEFYADDKNSLYFGKALVEAYEYGENQDWIACLLCPSAITKLSDVGLPANERLDYAYAKIPVKEPKPQLTNELPCLILGQWGLINNQNGCLTSLKEMRSALTTPGIIQKYDNTIAFIEQNIRTQIK
jgi:hypothetical protein